MSEFKVGDVVRTSMGMATLVAEINPADTLGRTVLARFPNNELSWYAVDELELVYRGPEPLPPPLPSFVLSNGERVAPKVSQMGGWVAPYLVLTHASLAARANSREDAIGFSRFWREVANRWDEITGTNQ